MAKWRKTISLKEYHWLMKPNEELSWSDTSLVEAITTPPRTILTACHTNSSHPYLMVGVAGTTYVMRNDCGHWNFDVYSLLAEDSETIVLVKSVEPYHKIGKVIDNIPEFLRSSMPEKYMAKLQDLVNEDS